MDVWFTLFVLLIALLAAGGLALLLVGYIDTLPAAIAHGWRWALLVLLLPVLGPFLFCRRHWEHSARTGHQIIAGAVLTGLAVLLLYAIGPHFAARIVAGAPV
ncbi:hypothetical protein [Azovibrio restrictus]|uniref:hypothetical protein n=1 Tax=Azovibrio restrictus TaxID=146938 RepID=UPI0026EF2E7D|nr:hypothetical protein [Azovibrio restrictus]